MENNMIIYKLTSPVGKSYIGLTEKTLEHRLNQHKNDCNRFDRHLHKALRKYRIDQWQSEILEECTTRQELEDREKYYIEKFDTYHNGYNGTIAGDGVDPETASKLKQNYLYSERSAEHRAKLSQRFSENNPGDWTGKNLTEEHKQNISKSKKGKSINVDKEKLSKEMKRRWAEGKFANRPNASTAEEMIARGCTMKGRKQSDNQKKSVAKANQCKWSVRFPDGTINEITNLNQFCRDHNLDCGNLQRTQPGGNAKQHKGYTVLERLTLKHLNI